MTLHAKLADMEPVESPEYFAPEPTEAEEIAAERQHYRLEIWRKDQRIAELAATLNIARQAMQKVQVKLAVGDGVFSPDLAAAITEVNKQLD